MLNNYETARVALSLCMTSCCISDGIPVELYLPADERYQVCSPEHLTAALGLCGIDATLVHTPAVGAVVHDAIRRNWIAVCCSGAHSVPEQQRWMVAIGHIDHFVEFIGGGIDDGMLCSEPAHFENCVIVVRGRLGHAFTPYTPPVICS